MATESVVQVGSLAGALAHAGENGHAFVLLGHRADEFGDGDGLAHARAAVDARLAALDEGGQQVNDLQAGLERLHDGALILELRRGTVDGVVDVGFGRRPAVHRLAGHVEDAAQRDRADGNLDGRAGGDDLAAARHAVGRAHGDGAHRAAAQVLLHFQDEFALRRFQGQRLVNLRQLPFRELYVHDNATDGGDFTSCHIASRRSGQ